MDKSNRNSENKEKIIMGTVYLKSKSGESLIRADKPIKDSSKYLPSEETKGKAISELKKLGFTIEAIGTTISMSGSIKLFEKIFKVTISREKISVEDTISKIPQEYLIYKSSKPIMHISELEEIIEGVILATPAVLFKQ